MKKVIVPKSIQFAIFAYVKNNNNRNPIANMDIEPIIKAHFDISYIEWVTCSEIYCILNGKKEREYIHFDTVLS